MAKPSGLHKVLRLKSTPSTQTVARRLAEKGARAWTLVRADRQTRGRGRMERRWSSGLGGLYFSLILRPNISPSDLSELSACAAKACARALEQEAGLQVFIKAPNDILARPRGSRRPPRKVCGILLEASGDTRKVHWAVLGIGVNVNNRLSASLTEAAALSSLAGRRMDVESILKTILRLLRNSTAATAGRIPKVRGPVSGDSPTIPSGNARML